MRSLQSCATPVDLRAPVGAGPVPVVGGQRGAYVTALAPLALPKDFIYLGSPDRSRVRDLRLWALIIMLPYILIYLLF